MTYAAPVSSSSVTGGAVVTAQVVIAEVVVADVVVARMSEPVWLLLLSLMIKEGKV